MGEIIFKFIIFMVFSILLGYILIGPLDFNILNIPFLIIIFVLGTVINALIRISISLLSFWFEDSTPFHWIYDKLILVLGTIFPIELFPLWAQPIIKFTPIFVVIYGPAKLVVDFSMKTFYTILIIQLIYLLVSILLITLIYRKGVKKLNVNGG
jgi:ABC-2 type transport system permease protein